MELAYRDGKRVEPARGQTATCPACGEQVRAKCGPIITWHWAHISGTDCDDWSERDTQWHRDWQHLVPQARQEVVIGRRRADIVAPDGTVVELQHSTIGALEIRARESHYSRMIWIFDAIEPFEADRLNLRRRDQSDYRTFRWKHPRKSLMACRRTVLLDLGTEDLLRLGRIQPNAPCGGWGWLVPREQITGWLTGNPTRWAAPVIEGRSLVEAFR